MMTFITNYNEAAMLDTLFVLTDGELNPTTHTNTQREGEKKQKFSYQQQVFPLRLPTLHHSPGLFPLLQVKLSFLLLSF